MLWQAKRQELGVAGQLAANCVRPTSIGGPRLDGSPTFEPFLGGFLLAGRAGIDVTTKGLGSASGNRLHCLKLACGQRAAKARVVSRSVAAKDIAQLGHRMPAESVSSTPLASSCAFWVRWA